MASWEYAYAMAGGANGGRIHPVHEATRRRTDALTARCRDLRARIAEHGSSSQVARQPGPLTTGPW